MTATYVHRVRAGTSLNDVPVENFGRLRFAINLRTAREIGITVPPTVRALADKVIDS
jgi:putative ABC transport system substrate-binding protein